MALYQRNLEKIKQQCKIQTSLSYQDHAVSLRSNYWYVITRQPTVLHINCLTSNSYKQLQFPADLIHLNDDCEAVSTTLMIPSHSQILNKDNEALSATHGIVFQLNYTKIHDFHVIQHILPHRLSEKELAMIDKNIPDVVQSTMQAMQEKIQNITTQYPYVLPEYLKIIFTCLGTTLLIALGITVIVCRKKNCTAWGTGFHKSKRVNHCINPPSKVLLAEKNSPAWTSSHARARPSCRVEEIRVGAYDDTNLTSSQNGRQTNASRQRDKPHRPTLKTGCSYNARDSGTRIGENSRTGLRPVFQEKALKVERTSS